MTVPPIVYWARNALWKALLCPLGIHGPRTAPDGTLANFCGYGCGHAFIPNSFQTWIVTLTTGETFEVQAVNAYHAGSVIVYGGDNRIDWKTGEPLGQVNIHRDNIASAVLKHSTDAPVLHG